MSQPGNVKVAAAPLAIQNVCRRRKRSQGESGPDAKKSTGSLQQPQACPVSTGGQPELYAGSDPFAWHPTEAAATCNQSWRACHTHDNPAIKICDRFLLGECYAGLQCFLHHTLLPYHWQLRVTLSKTWVRVGPTAQEHLERNYCNMNTDTVTLEDSNGGTTKLDLTDLSFTNTKNWKYDGARRLCNSRDPDVNPYFPAQWRVCWKEKGVWEDYEALLSQRLSVAIEYGAWNTAFEIEGRIYYADLKCLTQRNVKSGYTRPIRHRPVYRPYRSMAPHLQTMAEHLPCTPNDARITDVLFPSTWVMEPWDPAVIFLKVPILRGEPAYNRIETHFHKTLSEDEAMVFGIYRIQNKYLWQKYQWQKQHMSFGRNEAEKLSLEKHLYHGTSQDNVDAICQENFDPRVSGTHGIVYGDGSYFAMDASYSHKYAPLAPKGYRHMFLAKVLVGRLAPGKSSYRRPPSLGAGLALYDSCVDNVSNPKIFVIFDSCQCYPFFLIQYKMLSEPIVVDE